MENSNNKNLVTSAMALENNLCQPGRLSRESVAELTTALAANAITCHVFEAHCDDFDSWSSMTVELSFTQAELEPLVKNDAFVTTVFERCAERFWQWIGAKYTRIYIDCDDVRLSMGKDVALGQIVAGFHIKYVLPT